jgi:hypothetical protein
VLGGVKVFGGVLVLGRIAATDVAATEAQAQVDPFITHLQAFFAAVSMRFDVANLIDVGTTVHGSILNLDLQQAGGGFSEDRAAISVAESGRLEYLIDGGGAPGKWIVGAEHDLARATLGHKMTHTFWSEDDRIEIRLPQVFRGVFFGAVARTWRPDAAVIGPPSVGGQIAAGVGCADFQAGEPIEHAVENQVGQKNRGLERIADDIA